MSAVRLAFALSSAIVLVTAGARAARACSCLPPAPPIEASARATAVFEGRTFAARRVQNEVIFSFEVTRVWKGEVSPEVVVYTATHSASCGRAYELGVPYIVYASARDDGALVDNLCSRSRTLVDAVEDLDVLGAGRPPLQDGASVPPPSGPDVEPPRIEPGTQAGAEPSPASPGKRGCTLADAPVGALPAGLSLAFVLACCRRSRSSRSSGKGSSP
ncbi:MAG TPA: hypothetical protein VFG69_02780 [Nannocystaceae bacterium]|nr:hypothetical protein [Nannocystaceae bacterium]